MTVILLILILQGVLGAVDTLWHHELEARLPSQPGARLELALHAAREAIYAVVFLTLGWLAWHGVWAIVLAAMLLVEIGITLKDFLVEDCTRRLPPTERVLHTLMAIGFGAFLAVTAPLLWAWAQAPSGFAIEGHGGLSWITTALGVGVLAWAVRDAIAVLMLKSEAPSAPAHPSGRTVLVTGATGFIGAALVQRLTTRGDRMIILARDGLSARTRFGAGVLVVERLAQIVSETRIDHIINLAGAPIAGGPWSKGRRRVLLDSRLAATRAVLDLMARLDHKPQALINASAVGFYGDRRDELLDESAGPRPGFMSELCRRWEDEAWLAEAQGVRVCRLRLGLVLDVSGGILPMLALPARAGFGAVLGDGRQWAPCIARGDVLRLIERAMDDARFEGPINAVAPDLVTQGEFTRLLSAAYGWGQWLRVPAWPVRLALGEMSDLLLASQRVAPARLDALGFTFETPRLEGAFRPRRRQRPGGRRAGDADPAARCEPA